MISFRYTIRDTTVGVAFYSIEIGGSQTIRIKIEDLIGMQFNI